MEGEMSLQDPEIESILRATQELGMPAPRLQFTWIAESEDWSHKSCIYTLVLPLRKLDIRRESENGQKVRREWHAELGTTMSTGGKRPVFDGRVDSPFRDGAHAQWDSEILGGLTVYAVCGEDFTKLGKGPQ